MVVPGFGERLNTYGAEHWREFATQNYFDRNGTFFSFMISAPLLGDAFLIVVRLRYVGRG